MRTATLAQPIDHLLKDLFAIEITGTLIFRQEFLDIFDLCAIKGIVLRHQQGNGVLPVLKFFSQGLRFSPRAGSGSATVCSIFRGHNSLLPAVEIGGTLIITVGAVLAVLRL